MDRMSPLDAVFLHIEDDVMHMHIASCATFEGPAPVYEDLVELFRTKIHLVPRYRQRVRFVPGGIGRPVWVDDPHFRLDYHVRHTALPPPGDDQALRNLMGRLMSQPLDRNRPLWETWMVEGLESGEWALISKVHHCMVDGISGTDLMAVILDISRDGTPTAPDDWHPMPEPSDAALVRDAIASTMANPREIVRWARAATRAPRQLLNQANEVGRGVVELGRRLTPNAPLSIEGTIGPHRRWAWSRTTIADIKQVRVAFGGTVNDVVLSAVTNGFRELLQSRGEVVDDLVVRTLVPVSVRGSDDHSYNNQVAGMVAELPVGIADPLERLAAIREHMTGLKESHQAVASSAVFGMAEFAPPVLFSLGLRGAANLMRRMPQRSVNTVTTNVPGPQMPLFACGREMLDYFPFVPLSQGVRTGVAIMSYNGKVTFGVTGDWDTVPDLDVLAHGIEGGMAELLRLAARTRTRPARKKTGARTTR